MSILIAVYFTTARLGLTMNTGSGFATLIWPPSGIALAALLIQGFSLWPGITIAAFLANLATGAPVLTSLGISLGNTFEAMSAAYVLIRFADFHKNFDRLRDVATFVLLAVILSTTLSATIGVSCLWLNGAVPSADFGRTWTIWWAGDGLGDLIVAPLLLTWASWITESLRSQAEIKLKNIFEAASLFLSTLLVCFLLFSPLAINSGLQAFPRPFMLFPFFIWAALRFGQRGATSVSIIVSILGAWGTLLGVGPFTQGSLIENIISLNTYLVVMISTAMALAAAIAEKESRKQALHESEAFKTTFFETSLDCIITMDQEGKIRGFNPAAEKTFGYSRKEAIGQVLAQLLIPTRYRESHQIGLNRYLSSGEAPILNRRVELTGLRKDGTEFPVELTVTTVHKEGPLIFSGSLRDISERKDAEQQIMKAKDDLEQKVKERTLALNKSEAMLMEAQQLAHIGSWEWDIPTDTLTWSKELYAIYDLKYPEFKPTFQDYLNKVPFEQQEVVSKSIENALLSGLDFDYRHPILRREGETRILHIVGKATCDPIGKPIRLFGMCQDITERTKAEEEIKQLYEDLENRVRERTSELANANEKLSILAESYKLFSASLDFETTVKAVAQFVVPHFSEWCSVDILADSHITNVAVAHADPQKLRLAEDIRKRYPINVDDPFGIAQVLRTGQPILRSEITDELLSSAAQNDNHLEIIKNLNIKSVMIVPMTTRGKTIGAITFVAGSSGKIYNEADLGIAKELAKRAALALDNATLFRESQEAIQTRDEFMSIASHELKTPLTILRLQLQLAKLHITKDSMDVIFDKSMKQVDSLTHLIDQLLDVSRIQYGKLSQDVEEISLSKIVMDVISKFSEQLASVHCKLDVDVEPNVIGCWDPIRFEQILVNLISNVIKYAPGYSARVALRGHGDKATLIVQDFGPGIPIEKQDNVFNRFERFASRKSIGGLGLGLFIVKKIIEAQHGSIKLESTLGQGCKFTLEMPLNLDQHKLTMALTG